MTTPANTTAPDLPLPPPDAPEAPTPSAGLPEWWQKALLAPGATEPPAWQHFGVPATGKSQSIPICNADSAERILELHPALRESIWFDQFRHRLMTCWEGDGPREWREVDTQRLLIFLQRELGLTRLTKASVEDAVMVFGMSHPRHEVRDWLTTLTWDQTPRIETCFTTHFGAGDSPYVRAASRNFWLGLIARILRPGCQVDHMVVLEGPQGQGKTAALRALGGPWYLSMSESVMGKDFFQSLPGHLIVELAELDSFQRAELTRIKSVLSTPIDYYRPSYGRAVQAYPRQCVFVGTTNEEHYLRDMTGARRFWPVGCREIDVLGLVEVREQLFAEAIARFTPETRWWEMPMETPEEQEARREEDPWEPLVREFLLDRVDITSSELLIEGLHVPPGQLSRLDQLRAVTILRKCGWKRRTVRQGDHFTKRWCRSEEVSESEREPGGDDAFVENT